MKILLISLLLLTSCAEFQRTPQYKPYANRLDECIRQYLLLDIKPEQAVEICKAIHGDRN